MKKLVFALISLLIAASASAQISFGVMGGLTSSKPNIEKFEPKSANRYHAGVALRIKTPLPGFVVQPALLYEVQGTSFDKVLEGGKLETIDAEQGYLKLAAQAQLGTDLLIGRVFGIAEPFVGYGITNEIKQLQKGVDTKTVANDWDYMNKLHYGVGLGAGVEVLGMVQLSARYYWNFGKVYNGKDAVSGDDVWKTFQEAMKTEKPFSGLLISAAIFF